MSAHMVSTWGIVLEAEELGAAAPTAVGLFDAGRAAYLARCPALAAAAAAAGAEVRVTVERIGDAGGADLAGASVGASVIEVRPTSIEMAVRIRPAGDGTPIDGRCTLAIVADATGEPVPVPREVRDELIAIQLGARSYL